MICKASGWQGQNEIQVATFCHHQPEMLRKCKDGTRTVPNKHWIVMILHQGIHDAINTTEKKTQQLKWKACCRTWSALSSRHQRKLLGTYIARPSG